MRKAVPLALALALGMAASAQAQSRKERGFAEGTPVVIVGMVSSQPRDAGFVNEKKMQVAVGTAKRDYTLHLKDAKLYGQHGGELGISDFQDKMWVRAEGRMMDDPRRVAVGRLQVIGKDVPSLAHTAYNRRGFEHGYIMATGSPTVPAEFPQGTPVTVLGRVSSPPKGEIEEKKMQVAIGQPGTDYTLHFRKAQLIGLHGERIDEDGLNDGMWVRAEGRVMNDPKRIRVTRVQVVGKDQPALVQSAFHRPGLEHGYVMAVAGARQTFPLTTAPLFAEVAVTLVGRVSDDTGPLEATRKLQVKAAGNEWTLHVPDEATVVDEKGEKLSVHEIKEGQWIRVTGWQTEDLRMRVGRIENIGRDEAYRGSKLFRSATPQGYFERSLETPNR